MAIPNDVFKTRVALTPCFFELVDVGVVSKDEAELLRRICRVCDLEEADALLNGD